MSERWEEGGELKGGSKEQERLKEAYFYHHSIGELQKYHPHMYTQLVTHAAAIGTHMYMN